MSRLRLGLLGTGVAARKLYLPAFARCRDRVEVIACAARRRESAAAYARLAGIPEVETTGRTLLARPDLDAVFISLPIHLQPAWVLRALTAGKAVLSEKPVAHTVAAGRRLVAAASAFGPSWLVAENLGFMPELARLQSWLAKGRIGDVRLVEVRQVAWLDRRNAYFNTAWRAEPKHIGGFVVDGGVHLAHIVRRLVGVPAEVKGLTTQFEPTLPPIDTAVAVLRFAGGALGTWTSCFTAHDDGPLVRVLGSRATAELFRDRAVLRLAGGREIVYRSGVDSYEAELRHFADVVTKGVPVAITPLDALADLELIAAIAGERHARRPRTAGRRES